MVAVVVAVEGPGVERVAQSRFHCETVIRMFGRMVEGSMKSSASLIRWFRSLYLSGGQILKAMAQVGLLEKSYTWGRMGLLLLLVVLSGVAVVVLVRWKGH